MNLILNSRSLTKNNHAAPGDLVRCYEVLKTWCLGISPQELIAPQCSRMRNLSATPLHQAGQLLLCFLIIPNCFELKSRGGDTLVWVWGKCTEHEPFFPLQNCSANLLGMIHIWAGQAFPCQELSQLFCHSHVLQTDEDFLHCFFHLKLFTKPFLYAVPVKRLCCMC